MGPSPADGVFARAALLPGGWAENVALRFAVDGTITSVSVGTSPDGLSIAEGPVIPGAVNVHSHAFQRALVGRVQRLSGADDFWTWRERMVRLVGVLSPDDVEILTMRLYRELLVHGYTSVAEFHYLHRDEQGAAYETPEELALRIVSAARKTGIGLTLLPVLYRWTGFDRRPLEGPFRRFFLSPDEYSGIVERLARASREQGFSLGLAPHSLRAVADDDLAELWALGRADWPIHIHVAEQIGEVEACLAHTGLSPARWLLEHADLDARWTLVHTTHTSPDERRDLAAANVTIGLCPTTEGDLGDGFFPFADWLGHGGAFAIGSDSQVSVSAGEELRALLYRTRLDQRRRGVVTPDARVGHGTALWAASARDGGRAIGRQTGALKAGSKADLLVLDSHAPLLAGLTPDDAANAFVLSGSAADLARVIVGGKTVVEQGRHLVDDTLRTIWPGTAERIARALA